MKRNKIIAIIAVVVVLSMSLAAFALAAGSNPSVAANLATVPAGETVTFRITTNNLDLQGTVVAPAALGNAVITTDVAQLVPLGQTRFAAMGAAWIDYTYTIPAGAVAGTVYTFTITDLIGGDAAGETTPWDARSAQVTVAATGTDPDPSPSPSPGTPPPPPPGTPDTPRPPKVGDEPASSAPIVIGAIAVLVLGIFGYVKLK